MRIEVPHRITSKMVLEIRQSWERLGLSSESQGFQVHEFLRDVGDILRGGGVAKVQPPCGCLWVTDESDSIVCDKHAAELWKEIERGGKKEMVFEREVQHG